MSTDDRLAEFVTKALAMSLEVAPLNDAIGTILYESDVTVTQRSSQMLHIDVKIKGYPMRTFVLQVFES